MYVVVDRCSSKLDNMVSGVPQGSVLGQQLFLLYTAELFSIVENKLYGYAGDSTLVAVVPSPGERVAVSESSFVSESSWHPLSGAVPLPYMPARVTRGALAAHRHSFVPTRCRTSQYRRTFVPLSVSL